MRVARYPLCGYAAAALLLLTVRTTATAAREPGQLGDLTGPWQLLVDDYLVSEKAGVVRAYHAFRRLGDKPVLVPDKPWEGSMAYLYGTVLPGENGSGYRVWYHSWAEGEYRTLYAVSADGLTWKKPDLGFVDYKGSTKNNMLFHRTREDHTPQVIHTPWETDPGRRYKLMNFDYGRTPPTHTVSGYYLAWSPDGVRWTDAPRNPVLPDPGDVGCFVWDQHTRRYIGYPKKFTDVRGVNRRCVGFSETFNCESWPASRIVMIPDEFDDRWVTRSGQRTEFYGLSGFAYESMYIGFLWVFRITDGNNDGPIFVELVSSHDGVNWLRQEEPRTPVLSVGAKGSWDAGMVFTPNHPLVEGDAIKLFYGGIDVTHGADNARAAIGLATLRKDGFASLEAGATPGTVTTKKLQGATGPLRVNYKADGGSLKVEVLDGAGKVLPGFAREDCTPLIGDSVDQAVRWKSSNELPRVAGPVRLRFVLQNAAIYSFAVDGSPQVLQPDAGVVYTFEGDQTGTASDKLTSDGAQAARFRNGVAVDAAKANAAFGSSSLAFRGDGSRLDTLEVSGTAALGTEFTLAAAIKPVTKGLTRLFSNYRGSGPPWTSELILDFDPGHSAVSGLRGVVNGSAVEGAAENLADGKYHHCAMTYADGQVRFFLDGDAIRRGFVPAGPVLLGTNLRIGEDLAGPANEQFAGSIDDVVVLRRALAPEEMKTLAQKGAEAFLAAAPETMRPLRPRRAPSVRIDEASFVPTKETAAESYLLSEPSRIVDGAEYPLLVFLHGAGGNHRQQWLDPEFDRLRKLAADRGYFVLSPDLGPTHWMNERADRVLAELLDRLLAEHPIDPRRIHVMGMSMGGGAALTFAAHHPDRVRSACDVFGVTDFVAFYRTSNHNESLRQAFGADPDARPDVYRRQSAMTNLDALASIPVFVLHGDSDKVVPVEHGRRLAEALKARKARVTYREVKGGRHENAIIRGLDEELLAFFDAAGAATAASPTSARAPVDIGSRLELFVDRYLIEKLDGATLVLQHPRPAGVVLRLDRPWEGIVSGYFTVIKDGDRYRMYYRGRPTISRADASPEAHEVACYAASRDGITWERPDLGLFDINGTRNNNVILTEPKTVTHNFCPFLDTKPGVPEAERFKAVGGTGSDGLYGFLSADGIHWRPVRQRALITKGAFDSQNVVFWSPTERLYLCYFRTWKNECRWISRCTSADFLNWSEPVDMTYGDTPNEHLYTNQTQPYFRAPHIYIATAARFNPGRRALTDEQVKQLDLENPRNYDGLKGDTSDAVLLSSRGRNRYDRTFMESFIRPGMDLRNWVARANYPALGVVPTGPAEMSIYIQRNYGQASACLERLTLRTDGFVSVNAPYAGGEMTTRPLTFTGRELVINFASSAVGGIRVEIQDESGKPVPGFTKSDALEIIGDDIERVVAWKGGTDVSRLAGRPVRLRFVMKDADLFSIRFR